jgi:hypothetical protein
MFQQEAGHRIGAEVSSVRDGRLRDLALVSGEAPGSLT